MRQTILTIDRWLTGLAWTLSCVLLAIICLGLGHGGEVAGAFRVLAAVHVD